MALRLFTFLLFFLITGCTTEDESKPSRTAIEELLISTAAERAADKLALELSSETKVFIDSGYFEGTDSKYAISAIKDSLLRQGAHLVDDKKNADTVIEIRAGALSMEVKSLLVGIPSFSVPIPLSANSLTFPEIALYKSEDQEGVAKFAFTAYEVKSGTLKGYMPPQFGFAHMRHKTIMIFYSWTTNDILPAKENSLAHEFLQPMDDND